MAFVAARMIEPLSDPGNAKQAPFLRKAFDLAAVPDRAELSITARGLYRAFVNGQRVGDDLLTPGWTTYWDRLSYQTYDVAPLLRAGANTLDIWLGDGWWRSQLLWHKIILHNTYGSRVGALAELSAGGTVLLATDATWKSGLLPITRNGLYFGEAYDARQEGLPADQGVAIASDFDPAILVPYEVNGVKALAPLTPVSTFVDSEGRTVYDFGQNTAGILSFTVEGEAGARVLAEHAEILDRGQFSRTNMRTAEARLEYTLKGTGPESYTPTFTYMGFRYARLAIEGRAAITSIVSIPMTSAIDRTGAITTGHPLVNRLVENTLWSQRSNFVDVPTDCPQRDERLGWTGDAQVFASTACYLFNSKSFLEKYIRDLMADQRPDGAVSHFSPDPTRHHESTVSGFYGATGWGDAITIVPWTLYQHYGDPGILREAMPAMVKWVDYLWSISEGPIVRPPRAWGQRGFTFGDWLQPSGPSDKPLPTIGDDAAATLYLYISLDVIAKAARVLGDAALAGRMSATAAAVRVAFAHEFITPAGRIANDDQTSYALALLHDLVPQDKRDAAIGYFKASIARCQGRIGTGFIGTPALLPALVKCGETELAEAVFLQEEVPGWLYQVKNGATTIWERWDAIKADGSVFDPAMNSYNHYAYGSVVQWLFEACAGFRTDPAEPGFAHILFEPLVLPRLGPVTASFKSPRGLVEAGWELTGDRVTYSVTVPERATGTLVLRPGYTGASIDGRPENAGDGEARFALTAGKHVITFDVKGRPAAAGLAHRPGFSA